ncbi:Peptidase M20, dimerisation domain [Ostreococcus tauri]|uniref:Peptidase M20, dimerisation domain n=1 Tax=Ostreococcus tauri TaxID=70448 RepID=A0A090M038_OSTTA|nr:Peptidase M20, dimerisation domain [Ostreococcus tauri]CEF97541.1 Peptidase M20, dimerisation domain [Ostreococcus tauri]|eukprot:XP_022838745.1 Peptidase M20, dimerisation domain [Ostreococcus tauri]
MLARVLTLVAVYATVVAADATDVSSVTVDVSSSSLTRDVLDRARNVKSYVQRVRRHIHQRPELMWEEEHTMSFIERELDALGITHERITATGVVATLGAGRRSVGLRADADALPLTEDTGLAYASKTEGKMHACGHDGHVAMLLGAARVLKEVHDEDPGAFPGTVRFIFQPAEEGGAGAKEMLKPRDGSRGMVDFDPPIQSVFGLHNWPYPEMPSGTAGTRGGTIMAGAGEFVIDIAGRGGHAAVPHKNVDVIVAGSAIVTALQTLVSRLTDPLDSVVVSVTVFNAGTASNIMADKATLRGTLRALNPKTFALMQQKVVDMAAATAVAHGCEASTSFEPEQYGKKRVPYPPTVNDPQAAQLAMNVAAQLFGAENTRDVVPVMPAEDFSFFGQTYPSVMMWLGAYNESAGSTHPLHSPKYILDENILTNGVALHAAYALSFLKNGFA